MKFREKIARWLSPLLDVALRSRTTVKFFLFPVLVLPFANFILDTTFTLFRRLIRREKWYQAHRSHVYQRMTDLGMTHRKVTSIEMLVVVASCAAAAACIPAGPAVRIALVVAVTAGIACGGLWVAGTGIGVSSPE